MAFYTTLETKNLEDDEVRHKRLPKSNTIVSTSQNGKKMFKCFHIILTFFYNYIILSVYVLL